MFLHEHPYTATSWSMPEVKQIMACAGVQTVVADQCMFGLTTKGGRRGQRMPAKKSTRFMTNSWHIAKELNVRCDGGHDHQALIGAQRAREAQVYPEGLCRAICKGLVKERQQRKGNTMPLLRFTKLERRNVRDREFESFHEEDEARPGEQRTACRSRL